MSLDLNLDLEKEIDVVWGAKEIQLNNKEITQPEDYVLIDSSAILFNQFYGYKNANHNYYTTIKGKQVDLSGVIGYLKYIQKILAQYEYKIPEKNIIHILDSEESSYYRTALYPEYKANRPPKDEDILFQKKILPLFLKALDYKFIQINGVESDDIIGTLATRLTTEGVPNNVLIVGMDKDLNQLLSKNVYILKEKRTISQNQYGEKIKSKEFVLYTPKYTIEKYGFDSDLFVDFLAFLGDKSDNIPGVKGIGEKTAIELIKKFTNVENVLRNLDQIKPNIANKIKQEKENLLLSKKLVLIQKYLPEVPDLEELKNELSDQEKKVFLRVLKNIFINEEENNQNLILSIEKKLV